MKSRNLVLFAFSFVFAGCADDDDCIDCPDGADADGGADGDMDGDSEVPTGSLTVRATAAGVEVNADITLDGSPAGYQTPHTFENLLVGMHSVLLSYPGRLQAPSPMEVNVTTEGTNVNIFLGYNLAGEWRRESDGLTSTWEMRDWEPDAYCPNGGLQVWGVQPVGRLCLEPDDSLSLCKTHSVECGRTWAAGRIMEDGRRVEFCELLHDQTYPDDCVAPYPLVYLRVD